MSVQKQKLAKEVAQRLKQAYGPIGTFLTHESVFQLLIAVILSAQCTDERVNLVTPSLFVKYPNAAKLKDASLEDIKEIIKSINFFNNKAKNIIETALVLSEKYSGQVPDVLDDLIALPGVGRKTANVVLGQHFNIPGITVDTHVNRVSSRIGFSQEKEPVKKEYALMKAWPKALWNDLSSLLIVHGRKVCTSRKAHCDDCVLLNICKQRFK
eukprot:COSAG01_NODE_740_length_13891_cov_35.573013_4_plen_212_part_00